MIRKNAQSIGDILKQFTKNSNLDAKIFEQKILTLWPEILGDEMASYTERIFLKNGVLYVKISSSVLRNELFMCRSKIIFALNEKLGAKAIHEIIFR